MSSEYDAGQRLLILRICGASLVQFVMVGALAAIVLLALSFIAPSSSSSTLRTLALIAIPLSALISILRSAAITTAFLLKRQRAKNL